MALQNSGTISIKNLDDEMLDPAAPHSLSEFYRSNGYTPATRPGTSSTNPGNTNPGNTNPGNSPSCGPVGGTSYTFFPIPGCPPGSAGTGVGPANYYGTASSPVSCGNHVFNINSNTLRCNGTGASAFNFFAYQCIPDGNLAGAGTQPQLANGGVWNVLDCTSSPGAITPGNPGNTNPGNTNPPVTNSNPPVSINSGVPSSGQISLADFYGATKT